jgi:enamine deaminase RidA (YjgF/YER057c/UK114 family)
LAESQSATKRLALLGLDLPAPPKPQARYMPARRVEDFIFVSGQLPFVDGALAATGTVGSDVTLDEGVTLARQAALNAMAVAADLVGGLDDLVAVRLTVWVASAPGFDRQHVVADGASALLLDVLGDAGQHARVAVAAPILPLSSPVEVEAMFTVQRG